MVVNNVYDLTQQCENFDKETFSILYVSLYEEFKRLEESMPDEWASNYNTHCKKLESMGRIIMYCTDVIQDFENFNQEDIQKIMNFVFYYQTKYKGLKRAKLVQTVNISNK